MILGSALTGVGRGEYILIIIKFVSFIDWADRKWMAMKWDGLYFTLILAFTSVYVMAPINHHGTKQASKKLTQNLAEFTYYLCNSFKCRY